MLVYNKSKAGRYHDIAGIVCQDCSAALELPNGAGIVVADGLGSCKHSDQGSKIAVSVVVNVLESMHLFGGGNKTLELVESYIRVAFAEACAAIEGYAVEQGNPVEDYLTTLSVAYYDGRHLVFGHAGDGAVVAISSFGRICKLTEEDNGETKSIVYPLQAGPSHWTFGYDGQEEFAGVFAVTDGLLEAFQPQLLRGSLYERLCAYAFQAGKACEDVNELTQANSLLVFNETNNCALFDMWSRAIRSKNQHFDCLLCDDLSIAITVNPELMTLIDCEYPEPDWQTLADTLNNELATSN